MASFAMTKHPAMVLAAGAAGAVGQHVTDTVGNQARVLLVCDPMMVELGHAERVSEAVEAAGHRVHLFHDLKSDPLESSVDAATTLAHDNDVNCVVGLGGGSAMDTAKVVAALAHLGTGCAPYRLATTQLPFRQTALIAMPTTAGTGSETTGTSIISQADGTKNWFWGPPLKPDLALMDPELTRGLPPFWTFFTGMDAIVHCIESRTNRYRYAENDTLAERGIFEGMAHLERAVKDGNDLEARAGMMRAAAHGGLAIANTGCAVGHNIGHALGTLAGVPHGRAVSIALVQTLDWAWGGNEIAFERVAEVCGVKGPEGLASRLHDLAHACGQSLMLQSQEKEKLSSQALAQDMVSDANIAMLESSARDAAKGDVERLAQAVLAA
ncbi:MAG: iron-containing alcohol dehydrogenase [Pseudomonadota bacterium]